MSDLAPILLFVYKRYETLKKTVRALTENHLAKDSVLIVFSDAAKTDSDSQIVEEIRAFLKDIKGFKEVIIYEAEENKGLANSIIEGVSKIINLYDRVIVLEDDLLVTPNFLDFMNGSLNAYEANDKVFSISGYSFNLGYCDDRIDTYFLNRGWSWGWATWKDRWNGVDWKVLKYDNFKKNSEKRKEFSLGGSDLNSMLDKQMSGKLDSWAIRWFFHQFEVSGLTVYPVLSKVYNNGFDANATHTTGSSTRYIPLLDKEFRRQFNFRNEIKVTEFYQRRFQKKMGLFARLISKTATILKVFKLSLL